MDSSLTEHVVAEYAQQYPALITFQQAAEIASVELGTIYDWSSRGLFDGYKHRCGRYARLVRNEFIQFLLDIES